MVIASCGVIYSAFKIIFLVEDSLFKFKCVVTVEMSLYK